MKVIIIIICLFFVQFLSGCNTTEKGSKDNEVPVAESVSYTISEDSFLSFVLAASDNDGDDLRYSIIDYPENGVISGDIPNLVYTPSSDFYGNDKFTYVANDGESDSAIATISFLIVSVIDPSLPLNDTGITYGGNYPENNNGECIGETILEQDCSKGLDVLNSDPEDGFSGFSFRKLDINGDELPNSAAGWSCIKDKVTGLMWESKQDDGLSRAGDTFSWYNTDSSSNGGREGDQIARPFICFGYDEFDMQTFCNTQAFVQRINKEGLCGYSDWRLPSKSELTSIISYGTNIAKIDSNFFPRNGSSVYWTSTPYASTQEHAWVVNYHDGESSGSLITNRFRVRLVRQ